LPRTWRLASAVRRPATPALMTPIMFESWVFGPLPAPVAAAPVTQAVCAAPSPGTPDWLELPQAVSVEAWVNNGGIPSVTTLMSLPLRLVPGRYVLADMALSQSTGDCTVQVTELTVTAG